MELTGTAAGLVLAAATLVACTPHPAAQSDADCLSAMELAGVTYLPLLVGDPSPGALGGAVGEAASLGCELDLPPGELGSYADPPEARQAFAVVGLPSSRVIAFASSDRRVHMLYAALDVTDATLVDGVLVRVRRSATAHRGRASPDACPDRRQQKAR
jgi:hypothetical protein